MIFTHIVTYATISNIVMVTIYIIKRTLKGYFMKLCIYMATHKKQDKFDKSYIKPIQVGADLTSADLYELKDNTLDNISYKNKTYSELTALHWIWKNSNYKYVGLCHYRRFFRITNIDKILIELDSGKIIVPKVDSLSTSIEKNYMLKHDKDIWNTMINVLQEKYPKDYELSTKLFKDNKMIPLNMLIARKDILDEYCKWLFDILFEVENRVDTSKLDEYQNRYTGFLSERLLLLHIKARDIPFIETQIVDENGTRAIRSSAGKTINKGHFIKNKILGSS